jgi:hypothetical protein
MTEITTDDDRAATAIAILITGRIRGEVREHGGFYMPDPPFKAFEKEVSDREISILRQHMGHLADQLDDLMLKWLIVEQWWKSRQEVKLERQGYIQIPADLLARVQRLAEERRVTPQTLICSLVKACVIQLEEDAR